MESAYALTAYNSETICAYGTLENAHAYCEWLNRNRESDHYGPERLELTGNEADEDFLLLEDALEAIANETQP